MLLHRLATPRRPGSMSFCSEDLWQPASLCCDSRYRLAFDLSRSSYSELFSELIRADNSINDDAKSDCVDLIHESVSAVNVPEATLVHLCEKEVITLRVASHKVGSVPRDTRNTSQTAKANL